MLKRRIISAVFALLAASAVVVTAAADNDEDGPLAPADTGAIVTSLVNVKMGVQLEVISGHIPEGTTLEAVKQDSGKDEEMMSLNIFLLYNGNEIQPDGIVTLKIPLREELITRKSLYVYRIEEGGEYTFLDSTVKDGIITFNSDHFSTYVISARKLAKDGSPDTGVFLSAAPALVAACGVIVTMKKKKK